MLFSLFLFILYCVGVSCHLTICTQINSCSCITNSNETIDLSPLALSGGDARFKDQQDSSGSYYYSWNPCYPFTEDPTACAGVMGCQTDMTNYFNLGTPDSAKFITDTSKGLILQYSATTDAARTLDVILVCDEDTEASLSVAGENPPGSATYEMTLTSKHCCLRAPTTPLPTTTTTTSSPHPTTIQPCPAPFGYDTIIWIQIAIFIKMLFSLLLYILCCTSVSCKLIGDCIKINSCSCITNSSEIIDLSPLALSDGEPRVVRQIRKRILIWEPKIVLNFTITN
ncbi:hypothetical protein LOTGIDRAFT_169278 [Lottia gigantea]|uniref:MRH domain-containing protein n=1 Tax=Lottia gigantea TaxID=225164 RepID=V4B4R5_LOTGI|nr:hypothetical protein LOTGIDRAFT_169278 [Lottia gigantea]ESO83414.1 hypothetical protein LOTGIDRAFT_169278 [Lottia gigantea]